MVTIVTLGIVWIMNNKEPFVYITLGIPNIKRTFFHDCNGHVGWQWQDTTSYSMTMTGTLQWEVATMHLRYARQFGARLTHAVIQHIWLLSAWDTWQPYSASWVCCYYVVFRLFWLWCETLTAWKIASLSVSSLISVSAKALGAWPEANILLRFFSSVWCTVICLWWYIVMRCVISLIVSSRCVFHFEVKAVVPISWSWRVVLVFDLGLFHFIFSALWKDDQRCKGESAHSCARVTRLLSPRRWEIDPYAIICTTPQLFHPFELKISLNPTGLASTMSSIPLPGL